MIFVMIDTSVPKRSVRYSAELDIRTHIHTDTYSYGQTDNVIFRDRHFAPQISVCVFFYVNRHKSREDSQYITSFRHLILLHFAIYSSQLFLKTPKQIVRV